jgi:hypothetical protein
MVTAIIKGSIVKKIIGRILSEILFYLGHCISFPMSWFDWVWLYPTYNRLMCWSCDIQDWSGNNKPWEKTE